MERPEFCTDEHLGFLDILKRSGINMFGADTFLEDEFYITTDEAKKILTFWVDKRK